MKIIDANLDPAIVDIEIPELNNVDIDSLFSSKSQRLDYGDLIVYDGRETILDNEEHSKLCNMLNPFIHEILEKLLSMDNVRYPKNQTKNLLNNNYKIGILPTIDYEGFSQPWHLDNRFIIISGSINVQDNEVKTHFADKNYHWTTNGKSFDNCNVIHRGRNKKFEGTCWLNTDTTWHCVPYVPAMRKTILFNAFFI